MTVLIDSWAWIEYFKGSKSGGQVKEIIEDSDERAVISAVNVAEVYGWILRYYDEGVAEEKRAAMRERAFVCDVDEEIAVEAARTKQQKKWGLGDAIVFATAKKSEATIVTGDPHFRDLENVIFLG